MGYRKLVIDTLQNDIIGYIVHKYSYADIRKTSAYCISNGFGRHPFTYPRTYLLSSYF